MTKFSANRKIKQMFVKLSSLPEEIRSKVTELADTIFVTLMLEKLPKEKANTFYNLTVEKGLYSKEAIDYLKSYDEGILDWVRNEIRKELSNSLGLDVTMVNANNMIDMTGDDR